MDNITRIWHGRTSLANADSYLQFLLTDGTREEDARGCGRY